MSAKSADHVVMGPTGQFVCSHCGVIYTAGWPMTVRMMEVISRTFTTEHRKCKPSSAGDALMAPAPSVYAWPSSMDTGTSSATIWAVMMGKTAPLPGFGRFDIPYDPSDFGRCNRLLKIAPPHWRSNLSRVADVCPKWRPFVDAWSELEALWDEEVDNPNTRRKDGRAPKLYARIEELRVIRQ